MDGTKAGGDGVRPIDGLVIGMTGSDERGAVAARGGGRAGIDALEAFAVDAQTGLAVPTRCQGSEVVLLYVVSWTKDLGHHLILIDFERDRKVALESTLDVDSRVALGAGNASALAVAAHAADLLPTRRVDGSDVLNGLKRVCVDKLDFGDERRAGDVGPFI